MLDSFYFYLILATKIQQFYEIKHKYPFILPFYLQKCSNSGKRQSQPTLFSWRHSSLAAGVNHFTLCPWHDDHHPSLSLVEGTGKNYCHCFSCGKGGDVIAYAMQRGQWTFQEACTVCPQRQECLLVRQDMGRQRALAKGCRLSSGLSVRRTPAGTLSRQLCSPGGKSQECTLRNLGLSAVALAGYGQQGDAQAQDIADHLQQQLWAQPF